MSDVTLSGRTPIEKLILAELNDIVEMGSTLQDGTLQIRVKLN